MPEYLHPGVFVEEVSSGVRPIEGVGTSTAGFIGVTAKGVPNKATFVTSWTQFVRKFGYLIPNSYLPYAVSQFYANGGKRCYIVRALNQLSAVGAGRDLPSRETASPRNTLKISARGAGAWGNGLLVKIQNGSANPASEFKMVVSQDDPANVVELFDNLSMNPSADNYVETEINDASEYIEVRDLKASAAPAKASAVSAAALADPIAFAAGETLTVDTPDGTAATVTFTANMARPAALANITAALTPLNLSASLDGAGKLVIAHNSPGFDRYFILGGTATAVGRPLAGVAGFHQGAGDAVGGVVKSISAATFDTSAAKNVLNFTVHGDVLPAMNLTQNVALPVATVVSELRSEAAAKAAGLLTVSQEGNRVVVTTANRGTSDTALVVAGTADASLQLRGFDRASATVAGFGRSEAAFVQSAPGPFALANNSNLTITVNNGPPATPDIVITVNITSATVPNLAQVTANDLRTLINASTNAAGNIAASVEDNRVIVRQNRKGPFYTLKVDDGLKSPNIQLGFETARKRGYGEGDATSPYMRPAADFVANVNTPWVLQGGDDGGPVTNFDLIGTASAKSGLHALDDVTDVNMIAIPGATDPDVISKAVGYCTVRKDCFLIADSEGKITKDAALTDPPKAANFLTNRITTKTSYGALYYPWLLVSDDVGAGKNPQRYVPPSGFVAGMYARIDNTRGVWKAPAGTEAGIVGAIGLEYSVTDSEQDILNPVGVNCIRQFPASGIVIWGARTLGTQSDPEWRYVPVRRYAIYLEQTIYRGTQWAVFEPNDERLWASLKANIEDFMMGEFRKGALAGVTPKEAFEVKCDADLNPPSEVNAGRVNMEIRFAPLKPAEFVIIRISQKVQRPES